MMVVATVAFCIGGILVGGAGIFLLLMIGDIRALWTLHRIPVAPVTARGRVALEGATEYGPAGPQIAPLSGEDCTWYRVTLIREPSRDLARGDDSDHDVLLEITSPSWPALADQTGSVPIDPRLLDHPRALFDPIQTEPRAAVTTDIEYRRATPVRMPRIVPPDLVDGLRTSERLHLTEVRVPRGVKVFALGRLSSSGLRPSRAGLTMLTTLTRTEVIAARRESMGLGGTLAVVSGLIGLALAAGSAVLLLTM
ncbi:hypothetical protein [Actinoplanes sp. OR16]|uniref:hypothetical protein n=1 Tax=Actinoplanes sp. OR16 TaxID=946334 RepID=UPI000FD6BE56|nr:hypothetical protein [Actinoplanes sp. OR16]